MNNPSDQWQPGLYDDKHSFVWKLGSSVIELLDPQPGDRILDLGCGTGQLTAEISATGAETIGLDQSPAMIEEASRLYPQIQFQVGDAHDFQFDEPFDGLFSNAVLHWIHDPNCVIECVAKALKPAGRMAVEFGGMGNVRHLSAAIESAFATVMGEPRTHPWYFPGISEFGAVLEAHQLELTQAALIDRPTPLEGDEGLRNWVRMFGSHWLSQVPESQRDELLKLVEDNGRSTLLRDGVWHADYRRLRIVAIKR